MNQEQINSALKIMKISGMPNKVVTQEQADLMNQQDKYLRFNHQWTKGDEYYAFPYSVKVTTINGCA